MSKGIGHIPTPAETAWKDADRYYFAEGSYEAWNERQDISRFHEPVTPDPEDVDHDESPVCAKFLDHPSMEKKK